MNRKALLKATNHLAHTNAPSRPCPGRRRLKPFRASLDAVAFLRDKSLVTYWFKVAEREGFVLRVPIENTQLTDFLFCQIARKCQKCNSWAQFGHTTLRFEAG